MAVPLPDLQAMTTMDDRLRQVPRDADSFAQALTAGEREVITARASENPTRLRRALTWLGTARRIAGDFDRAERDLEEALALAQRDDDIGQKVGALIRLAELERCRNAFTRSETLLRVALALIRKSGTATYRDFALQHLGKTLADAGRTDEAITALEEALEIRVTGGKTDLIESTEQALGYARMASANDRESGIQRA